jgi:hypothetical protein
VNKKTHDKNLLQYPKFCQQKISYQKKQLQYPKFCSIGASLKAHAATGGTCDIRDARFLLVQTYQNGKNIPNYRKLYQTAINYAK